MARLRGIIESAPVNDNGFCSIKVNGVYYGTYKTDHSNLVGQEVEFDHTAKSKNGKEYHNANNVVAIGGAAAPAPAPAARAPAAAPAAAPAPAPQSSPAGDKRQNSIVLQSSYKTGADVLSTALQSGALTLKGAKAAQFEQLLAYLDECALHIFNNCSDPDVFLSQQSDDDGQEPDSDYNPLNS
jgi:hypothetical protein